MVPAQGELKLSNDFTFKYHLAENPRAAVHVGWLIGVAYLAKDILPKIDSCYKKGIKEFIIMGHSQGGALTLSDDFTFVQSSKARIFCQKIFVLKPIAVRHQKLAIYIMRMNMKI